MCWVWRVGVLQRAASPSRHRVPSHALRRLSAAVCSAVFTSARRGLRAVLDPAAAGLCERHPAPVAPRALLLAKASMGTGRHQSSPGMHKTVQGSGGGPGRAGGQARLLQTAAGIADVAAIEHYSCNTGVSTLYVFRRVAVAARLVRFKRAENSTTRVLLRPATRATPATVRNRAACPPGRPAPPSRPRTSMHAAARAAWSARRPAGALAAPHARGGMPARPRAPHSCP